MNKAGSFSFDVGFLNTFVPSAFVKGFSSSPGTLPAMPVTFQKHLYIIIDIVC